MKRWKRHLKWLGIGVVLGITLVILKNHYDIDETVFWHWYTIVGGLVILGCVGFNIGYNRWLFKKMNVYTPLLNEQQDPQGFIDGMDKLQSSAKGRYARGILNLNRSAGYCDLEEFETAKELLLAEDTQSVRGINGAIRAFNLSYVYFRLGETDKALELMEKNRKHLTRLKPMPTLAQTIATLEIWEAVSKERWDDAKARLTEAKEQFTDPRSESDWMLLEQKIANN